MIIKSLLQTDLYKFSMGAAVCQLYPYAEAEYEFINRGQHVFPEGFAAEMRREVTRMSSLGDERDVYFLNHVAPFFNPVYLGFLKSFRFNPGQVLITDEGPYNFTLKIRGPWRETILWEVPLMATICELYYKMTGIKEYNKELDYNVLDLAVTIAWSKADKFKEMGVKFADFGTRRRFSADHHAKIVKVLVEGGGDSFVGTSNVELAAENGLKAIGTQAHEWTQAMAAIYGYRYANHMALEKWVEVYHGNLGIALPDTFTAANFFKAFTMKYAKLFDGVRHDSGDPLLFADKVIQHYGNLKIDPMSKTIVFSDGLNLETVKRIHEHCEGKIGHSFGIGTNFSCDIEGVKPMNIVIKMTRAAPNGDDWVNVVKLSDNPMKHTGDPEEIKLCKGILGV